MLIIFLICNSDCNRASKDYRLSHNPEKSNSNGFSQGNRDTRFLYVVVFAFALKD